MHHKVRGEHEQFGVSIVRYYDLGSKFRSIDFFDFITVYKLATAVVLAKFSNAKIYWI
eukprot:SAG11_NODE_2300_length_3551_cov_1.734067_1_plen_58_part_00